MILSLSLKIEALRPEIDGKMVFEYKTNEQGHYVCGTCGAVKVKQNTMHYHLQRHEETPPYPCTKEGCTKKFYQNYALTNHVRLEHSTVPLQPAIKCPWPDCAKGFHKKEQCRVHIARAHLKSQLDPLILTKEGSSLHTCATCKKEYKSYPAILYHVMDHVKQTTDPVLKARLQII